MCIWMNNLKCQIFMSRLVTFSKGRDSIHDCKACMLCQLFWPLWVLVLGTFQCVQLSYWVPWILTTVENSFNSSLDRSETWCIPRRHCFSFEERDPEFCRWTTALPESVSTLEALSAPGRVGEAQWLCQSLLSPAIVVATEAIGNVISDWPLSLQKPCSLTLLITFCFLRRLPGWRALEWIASYP